MSAQLASAPAAGRPLSSKELMKMMVRGEKVEVLKYLRSLPSDESAAMRRKLLHGLDVMQHRRNGSTTSSGSESSENEMKGNGAAGGGKKAGDSSEDVTRAPSPMVSGRTDLPIQFQSSVERANTELAGKFRVTEVIGKGGFGTVLKGTSNETGDYVAIKQIDKFMIDAIQLPGIMKEAEILKRLNHPNIVKIYSFLETPNTLYFVLEYVEHGSLAGLLKKFGVFPEPLIASYTEQILKGLKYLHEEGIIHRDIKGDNILITKDGKVKLADFGTAKLEDAEKKTQTVVGTPYWMAPEVIEMSACGPTSDIWSLGCTVIELLTGAPPYFELGPMSALFNIVEDRHPPLPDNLSDDLRNFFKVCFKKDPRQRPTAAELVEHKWLKQFAKESSGDIEAVSGTLRLHNQQGVKKSVLSLFQDPNAPSASGTPGTEKKRKGSGQSASNPASPAPPSGSSSSSSSPPASSSNKKTGGTVSKAPGDNSARSSAAAAVVAPISSATAALAQPASPTSGTVSSKKLATKTSKAKTAASEHQKATSEMQAQYELQKKERDRLAKERQKMEEQLLLLRKETLSAHAQLNGLSLLLRSVGLESKSAKQSVKIVRSMQETIGKDTYIKLAYGHISRQSKSIRPAAILEDESRERRNSF